jgi:hypothetical protein
MIDWSDGCKAGTRLAKAGTGMVFGLRDRFSPPSKSKWQTDARFVMMGVWAETREYKLLPFSSLSCTVFLLSSFMRWVKILNWVYTKL